MAQKVIPHPKPEKAKHFIRAWRKYRRLTQEQLAERIEMTSGAISQLENGIINYTQPTLEAIAYALNCEPGDLLSRDPRTDDAVHDLRSILAKASATDQQKGAPDYPRNARDRQPMARKPKSDWEKAARALCSFDGIPENIVRDGRPMWTQYLDEARAVLIAIDRFYPEEGKEPEGKA